MVQSAELLVDDALADAVRDEWRLLSEAGLPSLADHRGPTNAPHVTVGVADEVDDAAEEALASVPLPGELRLGGLLVFAGPRRVVLARAVVATPALLATHVAVTEAWAHCPGRPDHLEPGRWTPHVTLALRLAPDRLGPAVQALAAAPRELVGRVSGLRRWDGDARRAWTVQETA